MNRIKFRRTAERIIVTEYVSRSNELARTVDWFSPKRIRR